MTLRSPPAAVWVAASLLVGLSACEKTPPPGAAGAPAGGTGLPVAAGEPTLPDELRPAPVATQAVAAGDDAATPAVDEPPTGPAAPPPHPGPWLVVTAPAVGVYTSPGFEKDHKFGYARNGARLPVKAKPVSTKSCSSGWYELVDGGFVCGNQGTTDVTHPQVKFAMRQPVIDDVLPYVYARNAKNGTPLYKSVPSRDQMHQYEPYLPSAKKARQQAERAVGDEQPGSDAGAETRKVSLSADAGPPSLERALEDAGITSAPESPEEPPSPWWQQDDKSKLHEVTLEQLSSEGDDVLARRMVAGFYVAVDKTFRWNDRLWYKTTRGLVAPADRFWQTEGSKFKGVELDGQGWSLPVAWVYGGRKTAPTYHIDGDDPPKPAKAVEAFTAIQLTGKSREVAKTSYLETKSGTWIKRVHVRVTEPGPPPRDLAPQERWLDVNVSQQTLVAYVGDKPVYATLVSTGKQSTVKAKDHRTPLGQWRVREKHVTTTMDGDGTAAGDLPYSIEDVPYVLYYHNSYAVHGAFWHRNYGIQMSHGCVNLAPLDAKHIFLFTDPPLPRGLHGVWSSKERPGSRVVVHE